MSSSTLFDFRMGLKGPTYALQNGTWAGQQEQVALARQYGVMIRVYQANQPAWTIRPDYPGFPKVFAKLIQHSTGQAALRCLCKDWDCITESVLVASLKGGGGVGLFPVA